MTNSEVDAFLTDWWIGGGKVFRYIREFMFDEYILISKRMVEPMFVVDPSSTYKLENMTVEQMVHKLRCGDLVWSTDQRSIDCRTMKTGGCDCGSWWKPSMKHADWCDLVKKRGFR